MKSHLSWAIERFRFFSLSCVCISYRDFAKLRLNRNDFIGKLFFVRPQNYESKKITCNCELPAIFQVYKDNKRWNSRRVRAQQVEERKLSFSLFISSSRLVDSNSFRRSASFHFRQWALKRQNWLTAFRRDECTWEVRHFRNCTYKTLCLLTSDVVEFRINGDDDTKKGDTFALSRIKKRRDNK